MTLSRTDFAPAANAPNARVDIVFTPNPVTLPDGLIAASTGAFTLEFVVDPNAPLDPRINALLANNAFFASQSLFGLDLSKAVSISALEESRNPLPSWLHFDARDRKSTRLNSSHVALSRMPSSA